MMSETVAVHSHQGHQDGVELNIDNAQDSCQQLPSPPNDTHDHKNKKRKRDDEGQPSAEAPRTKTSRLEEKPPLACPLQVLPQKQKYDPVAYWAQHATWPPNFAERIYIMGDAIVRKRSRTISYSQSVRDGENPPPYTRSHEEVMADAGIFMEFGLTKLTEDDNRCRDLITNARYSLPKHPAFQKSRHLKVLNRVRLRNEARVVRDITPILIPSPELLHIDNQQDSLEHATEALNAEWTQCATLCGPRPKPDFAVGISPAAFSPEQKKILRLHQTPHCPNLFAEGMYFPFLVCEVKSSERTMEEADRQAVHSASIAANAIVQLYRKTSLQHELDGKMLSISMTHNHHEIRIRGHSVKIGESVKFYRHRLFDADFVQAAENDADVDGWCKAYHFTRGIYEHFFPVHLKRIQDALEKLRPPTLESFTSHLDIESFDSAEPQEPSASGLSSQNRGYFKKPSLPPSSMMEQENQSLRDQLQNITQLMERQMTQQKENMERQMTQQKENMERQMTQQREMMQGQLAQQREMMQWQLAQQKETTKSKDQQLAQLQKIIDRMTGHDRGRE